MSGANARPARSASAIARSLKEQRSHQEMTAFTNIPKQVEEVLEKWNVTTSRRSFLKTTCIMGTTNLTVDQGGSGGSDAIQVDGWPMRRVAAEARRVLLDMASKRFGVPVDDLAVNDGVITVKADPAKKVTYGELIGSKKFNVTLTAANNNIDNTTGVAKVKPVQQLKMVGKSPQRYDIPPKVDGSLTWAVDVKLPGMVHARNVKPPVAG